MKDALEKLARTHGKLREVMFLAGPFHSKSLLVFEDGTTVRVGWNTEFSMLTFGYRGTGATAFSAFLASVDFPLKDVTNVKPPLIVKSDDGRVRGTAHSTGDTIVIQWDDNRPDTPVWRG
ncbi:MAG: hypothetical protein JXJ20_09945 [Anaerolineae bacterium]|jgi:hypothetical protein|nr:hypothetical protein [Anaerolineae bacterium]